MKAPKQSRNRTVTALKGLLLHGVKSAKFDARTGRLLEVEFFPYEFEGTLSTGNATAAKPGTPAQDQGRPDVVRESPKNAMDLVLSSNSLPDLQPDANEVPRTPKIERR